MSQKGLNTIFSKKVCYGISNSSEDIPLEFFDKSLGKPENYGIDLGKNRRFGWVLNYPVLYKNVKSFGECSLKYLDSKHLQLEWGPSRLGFSQAVMFIDFNLAIAEDLKLEPVISLPSYDVDFISWTGRNLEELFLSEIHINDKAFVSLSPGLIRKLRDINSLVLKLGDDTSAEEVMCKQFFFSE